MFAGGVCGKRADFEAIFGFSSSSNGPSAKKSRHSGFGTDDQLPSLIEMFPSSNCEMVENVLRSDAYKMEDAIATLQRHSLGGLAVTNEAQRHPSLMAGNCISIPGDQLLGQNVEAIHDTEQIDSFRNTLGDSRWVDMIVHDIMNAANLDDSRARAARILEAFERSIKDHSRASEELEYSSLRQQLDILVRDNQILKKAVSIQYERGLQQEEKTREVQHLKHVLFKHQEKIRSLELTNYSLKLHLQTAKVWAIPGCFTGTTYIELDHMFLTIIRFSIQFYTPKSSNYQSNSSSIRLAVCAEVL